MFLMLKEDKGRKDMSMSDFYPVGVTGTLETVDREGNVSVRTEERVEVTDLQVTEKAILAEVSEKKWSRILRKRSSRSDLTTCVLRCCVLSKGSSGESGRVLMSCTGNP